MINGNFPRLRRAALDFLIEIRQRGLNDAGRALYSDRIEALAQPDGRSFLLPEDGAIIDPDTPSRLTIETCRLPFPRCALEYSINPAMYQHAPPTHWRPSATVIIVEQSAEGGPISGKCVWRESLADGSTKWIPSSVGFVLTEKSTIDVRGKGSVFLDNLALSYADDHFKPATDELLNEAITDFAHEAQVLAHFVLLCNCDNVSATKIFEPSAKLIKRAAERGNMPPDEYYVLDCFLGEHQMRGPRGNGEHSSPRFHVRRGHIRRLREGRLTWVKQTTVGDIATGQITKDYSVKKKGPAE